MNNPFTTAEWSATYGLAGAVWKPEPTAGMIVQSKCVGNLNQIFATITNSTDLTGAPWVETTTGMGVSGSDAVPPLLPSPDWINQQSNPRAVAIAALERAGFITNSSREWCCVRIDTDSSPSATITLYHLTGKLWIDIDTADLALARYAVDCFEVLHAWAAAINWEVHDA